MTSEKFYSKALEANLAETRYKDIVIPKHLQDFIALSAKYYGINKRAQECIIEYLHPFSNRLFVVEQLREILISDFWFYSSLPEANNAFSVLIMLYNEILTTCEQEEIGKIIVKTLLEFINLIVKEKKTELFPAIHHSLKALYDNLDNNEKAYIINTRYFAKFLDTVVVIPEFEEEVITLTKDVYRNNLMFWRESTQIESWYEEKKDLLVDDFKTIFVKAGDDWFNELLGRAIFKKVGQWQYSVSLCKSWTWNNRLPRTCWYFTGNNADRT
jgi:hypothetical protein